MQVYNKNDPCMICLDALITTEVCFAFSCNHWCCLPCLVNINKCPLCHVKIDYHDLRPIGNSYQIFTRNWDGTTGCMQVNENTNGEDLGNYYMLKYNLSVRPRFLMAGRQLVLDKQMKDYGIKQESTIHVVFGLKGD